ncbi:MAG: hypothetical protein ACKVQB_00220 [Bacteroidia bacterium]
MKYKRFITDEIVLKDGSSQTGTILHSDTLNLQIKKIDESVGIIPWENVESVKGKKYRTFWLGGNLGYYHTPYFSVFRNEAMEAKHFGKQLKVGLAVRGNKLYYFNLFNSPANPYEVKKVGFGYQRYLAKTTYLGPTSVFAGYEVNFMNVTFNNGSQLTFEPFAGFEKKFKEQIRFHFKLGFQFNMGNKNNEMGFNMTIGTTLLRRNFKKHYDILNREHRFSK